MSLKATAERLSHELIAGYVASGTALSAGIAAFLDQLTHVAGLVVVIMSGLGAYWTYRANKAKALAAELEIQAAKRIGDITSPEVSP